MTLRIRYDSSEMNKNVPASRNNARSNQNGNVSFHQPVINSISTKKNHSPPNITIIKTDSNAGQLKAQSQLPLRHTLSDNKYPNKRHVDNPKFEFHMTKNFPKVPIRKTYKSTVKDKQAEISHRHHH